MKEPRPSGALRMPPAMSRPHRWLVPIACVVALVAVAPAGAATIDFDTYPGGGGVPPGASIADQWMSLGVIFSDELGGAVGASNNSCSISMPNHAYASTIVARFVDPATGSPALTAYAGTSQDNCWVPGEGIAMRAYGLDGSLLGSLFNSGGGNFAAFSYGSAVIARVEMDCVLQGIDNFVFNEPTVTGVAEVPATLRLAPLRNPSPDGRLTVALWLPSPAAARLELLDVTGRRVVSKLLEPAYPGPREVQLSEGQGLAPGMYVLRLTQGRQSLARRVAILR